VKAIAQDVYGPADVLQLRDMDQPKVGDGEVLVEVRGAGVDAGVWILMTGQPYAARLAFGLRRPKVAVRGMDVAGVVSAVGAGVTAFRQGDEVYGVCETGSFAEYATAKAKKLSRKPANLSFEQAAAAPISGVTALDALRAGRVQAGHRVLVTGAAGGVGSFIVQIAKAYGASVTGVSRTSKLDLVRSLGADDVIDYTEHEIDRDGAVYDVVIDIAGNRPLPMLRRATKPGGTIAMVGGGHQTYPVLGGMTRLFGLVLIAPLTGRKVRGVMSAVRAERLEELTKLIEAGKVTPAVERAYPLVDAPDALRRLATGQAAGKLVIVP
jgi:NADPH:quinone reductase-like Zn-dependent oxidoreductase